MSPWAPSAARLRVPPWLNSDAGITVSRAPWASASSALPSVDEESITISSYGSSSTWRASASRQRRRSSPPLRTGMITETMGADSSAARWRGALLSVPVRVAVTVVLLGAIALLVDWSEVRDAVSEGRWGWFAAAVGVLAAALVIGGLRWRLLLGAGGLLVGRAEALRAYFIGTFSNNFLPTGFGGDAARALIVGRGGSLVAAGTTVTVDRLSAIGCLLLVAAAAAIVDPGAVPGEL